MRFVDIAPLAALFSLSMLLSACPKKDADAAPEPATPATAEAPASDKAGAEPPAAAPVATPAAAPAAVAPAPAAAPAKKKVEDKGGW